MFSVYDSDEYFAAARGCQHSEKLYEDILDAYNEHFPKEIQKVEWLATKQSLTFERNVNGLIVSLPGKTSDELTYANVIKILS